jgi:S-DNA-T family DNA segregation ATPase FtsK/SpoIIIE
MADRRGGRLDFLGWGLLLTGLLVAVSVFSHHAVIAYPPRPDSSNLLGPPGAWLAQQLHETLGSAVHVLLASWFALVLVLLGSNRLTLMVRLAGWVLLLPCAAVLADFVGADALGGPLSGSGGSLGAFLADWLPEQFGFLGALLVFGGCLSLGLVLALDFVLCAIWTGAKSVAIWTGRGLAGFGQAVVWLDTRIRPRRLVPTIEIRHMGESVPETGGEAAAENAGDVNGIPIRHADGSDPEIPAAVPPPRILPINRPVYVPDEERFADFELPPLTLLEEPEPFPHDEHDQQLRDKAALLEKTFRDFALKVHVVGINTGPVITQYEVALDTGLRVHKVTNLADDLALNLKVPSVRVVAPIPGKNTVGIEIPNERRATVRLKEVIQNAGKKIAKCKVPLFLGKDTEGRPLVYDLAEMPHLLIAGRTGTGKSVCMNAIILSMLMTRRPDEVKMIMIDPKMLELSEYGKIPHLMHPVVKDMKKAEAILAWAVDKMEERYDLLSRARVRSIAGYNELGHDEILRRVQPEAEEADRIPERIPYIIIFVDEMNDLMMVMKREVEGHIIRLAQKSRAAGIHLVVATQKPTVDVITGLIKSNLPARICFQVSSRSDSRVVLDEMGADKLLGKGDMLFLQPGTSTLIRAQGTYAADEEITRVVEHLKCEPCYAPELVQLKTSGEGGSGGLDNLRARDDMYEPAIEVVVREGRGSVSLLQRSLGIGYGRAARLIDFMAEDGIVGAYNGSNAREVLFTPEEWEQMKQNNRAAARA